MPFATHDAPTPDDVQLTARELWLCAINRKLSAMLELQQRLGVSELIAHTAARRGAEIMAHAPEHPHWNEVVFEGKSYGHERPDGHLVYREGTSGWASRAGDGPPKGPWPGLTARQVMVLVDLSDPFPC